MAIIIIFFLEIMNIVPAGAIRNIALVAFCAFLKSVASLSWIRAKKNFGRAENKI